MLSGQLFFDLNCTGYVTKTLLWLPSVNIIDVVNPKQASVRVRFKHQVLIKKRMALSLSVLSTRSQVGVQITSNVTVAPFLKGNSFEGHKLSEQSLLYREVEEEDDDDEYYVAENESHMEMLRRERIGLANKGKIPWNKGITHNEVTRQKIKQRTIEALSNPKVRRKMSECFRYRSDECKEKISVSLRHVWAKRLNYPQQREEFYLSWFESVALAAKKGGKDQKELGWDSYDKITEELIRLKLNAKRNINNKIEEFSAPGRDGRLLKDRPTKKGKRRKCSKSDCEEEIIVLDDSNLQTRLSKIKKPAAVAIKTEACSSLAWEKLDLEYVKRENRQKISLADQIRAAKNLRKKLISTSPCSDQLIADMEPKII